MEPWIQETRNGFEMAEEEINRLEARPVQGEQSCMVQSDMKAWALKRVCGLMSLTRTLLFFTQWVVSGCNPTLLEWRSTDDS